MQVVEEETAALESTGKGVASQKKLEDAIGGQRTMNVNSWAPDSMRFAYVTYEVLP